jgi:phosphoglycerol transferase MdoB-like AlkP superfamily enzyme
MKSRLVFFVKVYLFFVLVFAVQKPLFMLYHLDQSAQVSVSDWFRVIWHGLPLDLSTAGYLSVIPGLLLVASVWLRRQITSRILNVYAAVILAVVAVIFVADMELYTYWGFRIDSTPLFYLKSPKDAAASVSSWEIAIGILAMVLSFWALWYAYRRLLRRGVDRLEDAARPFVASPVLLICTALLFIPIRGGFSVSTMNVGKVYFSTNLFLNHSAINPLFNVMASLGAEKAFDKQYRFMDDKEAHRIFATLQDKPPVKDSIPALLNTKRPNVILFVLESFMSKDIEALGGLPVARNLSRLCSEGVVFTDLYANSFRTDRGLIAVLSGYPAQPTTSVMKYPEKSQNLPSIQKSLKAVGYSPWFYYGGDADFTNMRSYFISSGMEKVVCDKDFPIKDRLTKWGAPDNILIERLLKDLQQPRKQPFMDVVLTLSSHEPFEVPMKRFANPYLNSVAFTDSCLGVFINRFRQTPLWKNTLIVFVPDHAMRYPATLENTDPARYRIPLIWTGGAVKAPCKINRLGSQTDIASTLLYQLGIDHSGFIFSKNMLNPASPAFGFFTFVDGFGFVSPKACAVYDHASKNVVRGDKNGEEFKKGQAMLQYLYDDLQKR